MALARNLRTLIVLGAVVSLMVTGAIWAHQAVAQDAPECPPAWPNQQYAGPLREKDHGRIQYQDYHTDSDGERWFVIRASDSNGYTTIRAYPASDDADGGYYADSPDQVCYLIVRRPGQTEDAAEPDQVVFPREREIQRTLVPTPTANPTLAPTRIPTLAPTRIPTLAPTRIPTLAPTRVPTLAPTPTPQVAPDSSPELSSLELDGEVINSRDIVRSGLSRSQEVRIALQVSDADGGLAYLALVAEDGTVLDRVDCANGMAQECTLTSALTAPSTYSATLRFRAVAVDDAGGETELATISLTTRARPSSPPVLTSLEVDGEIVSSNSIVRSGLSRGQAVQIILRVSDADGGLAYLALVAEDGAVLDRVDCANGVDQECTLTSALTAPSTYSATLRFRAVAVDDAGGETEVAAFSLTTGARPRSPTTPSRPVPRPPTTVSEQHTAGAEAVVEHSDGVQVQIPEAATAGTPSDEHSWTPGSAITEEPDDGNDRMVTVSIQAIDPPEGNVLEGGQVYNISFTDEDGDDVHLRQPVTLTLPYTLPDGKTASDVVVLHWDQRVRRWESADGGMVDEAAQTISVELQDFSPVRVSFYMTPLEFLSTAMLSFVGADLFQAQYDDGFKHTASIRGEVQFPLPFITFLGAKIGGTLILDLDDILSLVNESKQYTVEGEEGFFTYGLNLHLAITEPDLKGSTALKFPVLDVGRPTGSRYNHDVTFEGSTSALSIGVEGLDLSLLTLNENGNIEPVAAQLETCMACILNLVHDPHAIDIEAADTTINVAKGEFNTNFEEIVNNLEDECLESKCELTFADFIGLYLKWFTGGPLARAIAAYQAGQSIGLLHQYTSYEHIRPDLGASIGLGYSNGIEKTTGGHDVNGDGTADLVFPPDQPGGTPLQIWTTGDNLEDRRYFLELYELTEGWDIQVDTAKWHADLNPQVMEASEDALLRVDFEMQALSTNETHWLVTTLADAPNLGHASFRLVHERALLEGGTDVLVDDADLPLVKDKPFSDLSAQATVTPDRVSRGETLTYTVSLENRGPDPAENIELHLRSPVQHALLLTNASSSAGGPPSCQESDHFRGQICTLSNLAADESADVSLDFELRETLPHGETLRMSFVVVSDTEELAPGDNSAAADTTIRASDRGALEALYNATGGAGWSSNDNWLTDEPLGEWHGVNTDANGRVIELYLASNQLIGQLPAELGHLTGLRWLNLSQNQLTGELPAEWAGMTELEWLYLWDNQLTGSAPSWLGDLSSLVRLELSENGFTGAIPGNLGSLPRLELLMLNDNDLTGTIPVSLGSGTALRWLSLARNQLLGRIPTALGNLQNLQYLHLSGNAFTGCLPISLQNVMDNDFDALVSAGVAVCVEEGDLTPFALNPAKGFLLEANSYPFGMWSDGTTMWVADQISHKIYAYDLASRARDASKDFDTLVAAGNDAPRGMWSDGTTMWVADAVDGKLYAYDLASRARDASKDFDTLVAAGNNWPQGMWSDGTTMWVADAVDDRIYAYDLASRARDASKDFNTLVGVGNDAPRGMWSDGTTMWVVDAYDKKIYAYDLASKAWDASKDFNTLANNSNDRPTGIWSDGTTMWVADVYDGDYDRQISADYDRKIYAYGLASKARDASKDFNTLAGTGNDSPRGMWSDGTTMWVADTVDGKIYAYDLASKAWDASKDFNTLTLVGTGNHNPTGIWSDGTTMWVAEPDWSTEKIYAYDLASKAWDASKDFNTRDAADSDGVEGIWSDGTTMWVANSIDHKLYAYDLASKARDASKDFNTLAAAGNNYPYDIWSDGTTMWVVDVYSKIYAYDLASKARDASKDFNTLAAAGNHTPMGIWSDGITMWVGDLVDDKIYAYNMP